MQGGASLGMIDREMAQSCHFKKWGRELKFPYESQKAHSTSHANHKLKLRICLALGKGFGLRDHP